MSKPPGKGAGHFNFGIHQPVNAETCAFFKKRFDPIAAIDIIFILKERWTHSCLADFYKPLTEKYHERCNLDPVMHLQRTEWNRMQRCRATPSVENP
ncbi:uncharacterized protein Dmul_35880 [Desulfococcus multivorans]|nr:uncharacterized protein Dmul_35880 [Desulfococcus multivorans]